MAVANLTEQLAVLLGHPADELGALGDELDDVLMQAWEEGRRLLRDRQDGEVELLLRQAEALAVAGKRSDAARSLRILLGKLEASRNDYEGALAWYGAVLALPVEADTADGQDERLYAFARIADIRQDLDESGDRALTALSDLLQAAAESDRAEYAFPAAANLARAYLGMGQFDACVYFIEQAESWWRYEEQSGTPGAADQFATLVAEVARVLFYEGKDYQRALHWAQRALEIAPGTANALRIRGLARSELKDYRGAADAFRAWIEAEPANAAARNNLAGTLDSLGDSDAAVEAMAEAVRLEPDNLAFRHNLITLLRDLGRIDETITELDALIGIGRERERAEPWTSGRRYRSIAHYHQTAPAADWVDLALVARTEINMQRDRPELLARDIEELLARPDPLANAVGYQYRGRICERENDLPGALAAYGDALATGRPSPNAGELRSGGGVQGPLSACRGFVLVIGDDGGQCGDPQVGIGRASCRERV